MDVLGGGVKSIRARADIFSVGGVGLMVMGVSVLVSKRFVLVGLGCVVGGVGCEGVGGGGVGRCRRAIACGGWGACGKW